MFRNSVIPLRETIIMILAAFLPLTASLAQPLTYDLSSSGTVWKVGPQDEIPPGTDLRTTDTSTWVTAVVPGTVFSSYVAAGLEKDPNFGDNIYNVDKAKYDRNFWYRTEFTVPETFRKEKIWLHFGGINRKADIYLNGTLLGHLDGFMQRGQFDISAYAGRGTKNVLTVLVYLPKTPLANFASPTYLSSAGWDWMPYVPGLNMGITDKVYLSNTGSLTISDPWVRADLPTNARADLSVSMEIRNSSNVSQQGVVKGVIMPGNIGFSQNVSVNAGETAELRIDKRRFAQLILNRPLLWWPNGYGEPNLYTCRLSLTTEAGVSDEQSVRFGIRKYSYDTVGNVLHVSVNGTRVFIKGGNWGMAEYMLRCRGKEYDTKVRLHQEMNFNMIRNWLGSTTDEEFYEACDRHGIMVWDDFWLNANPNLPRDLNTFNANVIEKIKRFRNHPSIAVWCGDNEGWPEPPLNNWIKENISTFDGGERWYQANSHADNLTGSGMWGNYDPRYYFTAYPVAIGGNRGWGLRTEIGTAVVTNFESFKKFMPRDKWWPRNDMWDLHFFGPRAFNATPDHYDESITGRYGEPGGIEDYCRKAQLLNIETNKAMYEGWQDHIWEDASGIMTWMSQAAYPSLVWQTYDYYYDLTGAFWGAKKACEPLHIQWNPMTDDIKVINTTGKDVAGLTAEAAVYNTDGKIVKRYSRSEEITSPANTAVNCFNMEFGREKHNLALNKPVYASSTTYGEPSMLTDGRNDTRWSSKSRDDEWVYVDLGEEREVNGVGLNWQEAYAKVFKVQVSGDARSWKDVYSTTEGQPGEQDILFAEETARYVRIFGIERGTYWGYSLWNFEVYEGNVKSSDLTDVHFIKLQLKDKAGNIVSDNFYWRGNRRKDFTALNALPAARVKVTSKASRANGRYRVAAKITQPASAPSVAFAVRVQAVRSASGEQILPAIMSDNYFSLMPGETKEVIITFDEALLGKDGVRLIAEPYNHSSR